MLTIFIGANCSFNVWKLTIVHQHKYYKILFFFRNHVCPFLLCSVLLLSQTRLGVIEHTGKESQQSYKTRSCTCSCRVLTIILHYGVVCCCTCSLSKQLNMASGYKPPLESANLVCWLKDLNPTCAAGFNLPHMGLWTRAFNVTFLASEPRLWCLFPQLWHFLKALSIAMYVIEVRHYLH